MMENEDNEKGMPVLSVDADADADAVEGGGGQEKASRCSKLQSFIFGSLQKFFKCQVIEVNIAHIHSNMLFKWNHQVLLLLIQPHICVHVYVQGKLVGRFPLPFLILPIIITAACCYGFKM